MAGLILVMGLLLISQVPAFAQDLVHNEPIQFTHGASSKTIQGTINGYVSVNYLVAARAGQVMTVTFKTGNPSSYFNVIAQNAQEALFTGATSGNDARLQLPTNGTYTVQVYLMRNAARRDEIANYTITISIAG